MLPNSEFRFPTTIRTGSINIKPFCMPKLFIAALLLLSAPVKAISQAVSYEVYALKFSGAFDDKPYPLKFLVLGAPENETGMAVFMIWLIKGSNGKNILVDAGFHKDIEEAKDFGL